MDEAETKLKEEVAFWQHLVAKLELQGKGSAPPRIREVLAYAQQKLDAYRAGRAGSQDRLGSVGSGGGRSDEIVS